MLLGPYPPACKVVLDSVGESEVEIFLGRVMAVSAQCVVQMPIESLFHIRYVLHRCNCAHRDLLAALLMSFNHRITSFVFYLACKLTRTESGSVLNPQEGNGSVDLLRQGL